MEGPADKVGHNHNEVVAILCDTLLDDDGHSTKSKT
jgi:hypothetical protein